MSVDWNNELAKDKLQKISFYSDTIREIERVVAHESDPNWDLITPTLALNGRKGYDQPTKNYRIEDIIDWIIDLKKELETEKRSIAKLYFQGIACLDTFSRLIASERHGKFFLLQILSHLPSITTVNVRFQPCIVNICRTMIFL